MRLPLGRLPASTTCSTQKQADAEAPTRDRRGAAARRTALVLFALVLFALGVAGCGYIGRQATIFYLEVHSEFSPKEIEIELDKTFVEAYKNRVTINAALTVDRAMKTPAAPSLDGDLHFAGRTPQVALITVAELANAASFPRALALVHRADSTGKPLQLSGVWRIWPEHSGSSKVEQGRVVAPTDSYRPNHVFEIHPVTQVNRESLLESFTPVPGFSPGDARETFEIYEKTPCKLLVKPNTISIVTRKGLYNDVEFLMEITGDQPLVVEDGRFVMASALDLKGGLRAEHVRIVFAKGTAPERAVRRLRRGARLHVVGMPRVSFAEVLNRVRDSATDPGQLTRTIPYEIVVVGVFKDAP